MCGVIGISLDEVSESDLSLIQNVFLESMIRGKHATGVSYLKDGAIHTIKEPIPANEFVEKYDFHDFIDSKGGMNLIGHCRYSTSDLEFNQPIHIGRRSIVHNGVVSQELPSNWEELYGVKCETRNDSELLLHSRDILNEWPDASISALILDTGGIEVLRNGKRPLYETFVQHGSFFTSTADIAKRAGLAGVTRKIQYAGKDLQP
jgi:glutamine phosphoribosylpyrophosphate amidotransferase